MFAGMYPANFLSEGKHTLQIYPFLFLFFAPVIQASYCNSFFETVSKKSPHTDYSYLFVSAWSFEIKCKSSVYGQHHQLKSLPPQHILNKKCYLHNEFTKDFVSIFGKARLVYSSQWVLHALLPNPPSLHTRARSKDQ